MPVQTPQDPTAQAAGTGVDGDAATLTAQLAAMHDRWVRAEAEIANVRARAKRDLDDVRSYGTQKFANDMVEAAENLQRGLASLPAATPDEPQSLSGLRSGLAEVQRGFLGMLERNGVSMEDPTGAMFTPERHQAIGQRAVPAEEAGTIAHAVSPVWMLNGRLLRPAVVLVGAASTEPQA